MSDTATAPAAETATTGATAAAATSFLGASATPAPASTTAAPADGGKQTTTAPASSRPDYLPEKFWRADKNEADLEALSKSYTNLESMMGREKVPIPKDDDDTEGWERYWKAAGRPDSAELYEFERPELPQDMSYDEDMEKHFRQFSHANGLNKRQARNLYDGFAKIQIERQAAAQLAHKQHLEKLEKDLQREHGPDYEAAKTRALNVAAKYLDEQDRKFLNESGWGNDPRMIRMFAKMGKDMAGETRLHRGANETGATPADVASRIADFRKKHDADLKNPDAPSHKLRVEQLYGLHQELAALKSGASA